ncbi:MAG: hypothetical protein AAGC67_15125 [Myxococcota bacterium]
MHYTDRALLHTPEQLPFESGVERQADGVYHVAALTRMPGVRAEMIAWWFGSYMQTSEHYRRWHPRDHVWMDWADKLPGTHVGASHLVHEYIGRRLNKLAITFLDPAENMGPEAKTEGRLFVCARVSPLGRRDTTIARMVHAAYDDEHGCVLRSHFWMGIVETPALGGLAQKIANTRFARKRAVSHAAAQALEAHCFEEMTTLAGFLPALYASEPKG